MRVGFRTLISLVVCAATAGAALAHCAIDVVGDYALPRDSYDHLRHGSREALAALAFIAAAFLAARGLRICCEIAAANRTRLMRPVLRLRETVGTIAAAMLTSSAIVPAMEFFDGRLDGEPVRRLGDAFGGSIVLGLAITLICAALVALAVCVVARWLISYRDSIVTIVETLLRPLRSAVCASRYHDLRQTFTLRSRCTPNALRLAKRGPPVYSFG